MKKLVIILIVLGIGLTFSTKMIQAESVGIFQESADSETGRCYGPCYETNTRIFIEVSDIGELSHGLSRYYRINLLGQDWNEECRISESDISDGYGSCSFNLNISSIEEDKAVSKKIRVVKMVSQNGHGSSSIIHESELMIYVNCDGFSCAEENLEGKFDLCSQIASEQTSIKDRCIECFSADGIWTAVGCIPQTADKIIETIMQLGLVIAGAVVLIIILVGSFMLSTSQGDPKKTQEAKEMITSAVIGLLFIIFSITILQFIGVSIIKIPGFGE